MITILLMALSAAASPAPGAHAAAAGQEPLDEIVVKGARTQLVEIRQQMVDLEDRFYGRYNELMPNDLFDIHCDERALTAGATRSSRRYVSRTGAGTANSRDVAVVAGGLSVVAVTSAPHLKHERSYRK